MYNEDEEMEEGTPSKVDTLLERWLAGEDVSEDDDLWLEWDEKYADVDTYVKEDEDELDAG